MRLYIHCLRIKSAYYKFKSSIKKRRNNICIACLKMICHQGSWRYSAPLDLQKK